MIAALSDSARAKINLTLRVVRRRPDGYHELESLVAFAALADTLTLVPGGVPSLEVSGPFAPASGAPDQNLVLRAARALGLPSGRFRLAKHIPVAAGLGGGSADAAAALRLIARANGIAPDDPRLGTAARATGADVAVCLDGQARIMRGIGEQLSAPIKLPAIPAVLLNPGIALATTAVFSAFEAKDCSHQPLGEVPVQRDAPLEWLAGYGNDLTRAATACVPAIADALRALTAFPACRLARMSGSGATCFGLFDNDSGAKAAAEKLRASYPNWWVCETTIG